MSEQQGEITGAWFDEAQSIRIEEWLATRTAKIAAVRGLLSTYSPAHPLIVPSGMRKELEDIPELADMLNRIAPQQDIPTDPELTKDYFSYGTAVIGSNGQQIPLRDFLAPAEDEHTQGSPHDKC